MGSRVAGVWKHYSMKIILKKFENVRSMEKLVGYSIASLGRVVVQLAMVLVDSGGIKEEPNIS